MRSEAVRGCLAAIQDAGPQAIAYAVAGVDIGLDSREIAATVTAICDGLIMQRLLDPELIRHPLLVDVLRSWPACVGLLPRRRPRRDTDHVPGGLGRLRDGGRTSYISAELVRFLASADRRSDPRPGLRRRPEARSRPSSPLGHRGGDLARRGRPGATGPPVQQRESHIDLSHCASARCSWLLGTPMSPGTGAYFDSTQTAVVPRPARSHPPSQAGQPVVHTPAGTADLEVRIQIIADELLDADRANGRTELMASSPIRSPPA